MAISKRSLTDLTNLSSSEFGAVQGAEISQVHCALLCFPTFCVSTASLKRLKYALNNTKLEMYSYYIHMIANYYYKSYYYYNEVLHKLTILRAIDWEKEKDLGANLFRSKIHIECLIKFKTFVLFLFSSFKPQQVWNFTHQQNASFIQMLMRKAPAARTSLRNSTQD